MDLNNNHGHQPALKPNIAATVSVDNGANDQAMQEQQQQQQRRHQPPFPFGVPVGGFNMNHHSARPGTVGPHEANDNHGHQTAPQPHQPAPQRYNDQATQEQQQCRHQPPGHFNVPVGGFDMNHHSARPGTVGPHEANNNHGHQTAPQPGISAGMAITFYNANNQATQEQQQRWHQPAGQPQNFYSQGGTIVANGVSQGTSSNINNNNTYGASIGDRNHHHQQQQQQQQQVPPPQHLNSVGMSTNSEADQSSNNAHNGFSKSVPHSHKGLNENKHEEVHVALKSGYVEIPTELIPLEVSAIDPCHAKKYFMFYAHLDDKLRDSAIKDKLALAYDDDLGLKFQNILKQLHTDFHDAGKTAFKEYVISCFNEEGYRYEGQPLKSIHHARSIMKSEVVNNIVKTDPFYRLRVVWRCVESRANENSEFVSEILPKAMGKVCEKHKICFKPKVPNPNKKGKEKHCLLHTLVKIANHGARAFKTSWQKADLDKYGMALRVKAMNKNSKLAQQVHEVKVSAEFFSSCERNGDEHHAVYIIVKKTNVPHFGERTPTYDALLKHFTLTTKGVTPQVSGMMFSLAGASLKNEYSFHDMVQGLKNCWDQLAKIQGKASSNNGEVTILPSANTSYSSGKMSPLTVDNLSTLDMENFGNYNYGDGESMAMETNQKPQQYPNQLQQFQHYAPRYQPQQHCEQQFQHSGATNNVQYTGQLQQFQHSAPNRPVEKPASPIATEEGIAQAHTENRDMEKDTMDPPVETWAQAATEEVIAQAKDTLNIPLPLQDTQGAPTVLPPQETHTPNSPEDEACQEDSNTTNENTLYVIERVMGSRRVGERLEFRIKWKNHKKLTWEPMENVTDEYRLELERDRVSPLAYKYNAI